MQGRSLVDLIWNPGTHCSPIRVKSENSGIALVSGVGVCNDECSLVGVLPTFSMIRFISLKIVIF